MLKKLILMMVVLCITMPCTASPATTKGKKLEDQRTKQTAQKNIGYRYFVINEDSSVIIYAKESLSAVSQSERTDYPSGTMMQIIQGNILVIPPEYLRPLLSKYAKSEETKSIIAQYLELGLLQKNNNLILTRDCRTPMPLSTLIHIIGGYGENGGGLDLGNGTILSPSICLTKP